MRVTTKPDLNLWIWVSENDVQHYVYAHSINICHIYLKMNIFFFSIRETCNFRVTDNLIFHWFFSFVYRLSSHRPILYIYLLGGYIYGENKQLWHIDLDIKLFCSHMYKKKIITSQDLIFIAGPEQFRGSERYLTTLNNHRILRALGPFIWWKARVKQVFERSPHRTCFAVT